MIRNYYSDVKDCAIAEFTAQLAFYNECVKLLNAFKAVINKFDGKVYNKRIVTALQELCPNNNGQPTYDYISCYEENKYTSEKAVNLVLRPHGCYRSYKFNELWKYIKEDYFNFSLILDDDMKRIDAAKTLKRLDDITLVRLNGYINALECSIESYDKYQEDYEKLCNLIEEYNKNTPTYMRARFSVTYDY